MPSTRLMIRCPKTSKAFPTGIALDPSSYVSLSLENNRSKCPYCGESHTWDKKNTFFESESHN